MPNPGPNGITILREVHLRYGSREPLPTPLVDHHAAASFLRSVVSDTTRENAIAIYLDCKHRPVGWRVVSIGNDVGTQVKPSLVLQPAVLLGANAVIFAHNHPSGDPQPSGCDIVLATRLRDACKALGLRLLDNIIWTENQAVSYGPFLRGDEGNAA